MKTRVVCIVLAILSTMRFAVAQHAATSATGSAVSASFSVPRLIRFSGVAKDANGKPLTGTIGITFLLYKDQEGSAPLWMETQNVQPDANGHYSVQLGLTQPNGLATDLFTSGEARWLGVQPQGQGEQPRILLMSVPYAIKAYEAETLAGKQPSEFVLASDLQVRLKEARTNPARKDDSRQTTTPPPAVQEGAVDFTANTADQVVLVTQMGIGSALIATSHQTVGVEGHTTDTTALSYGVRGITESSSGFGVFGRANSGSGGTVGVEGISQSTGGIGVYGAVPASTGHTIGVQGTTASPTGVGVKGVGTANGGTGVLGLTTSTRQPGFGVLGQNNATSGNGVGVQGVSVSPTGSGVVGVGTAPGGGGVAGYNGSASGNGIGVYGSTASPTGKGVVGANTATSGGPAVGVQGFSGSPTGYGVVGESTGSQGVGVLGKSPLQGVYGETTGSGNAIVGQNDGGSGRLFVGVNGLTEKFSVDGSGNGFYAGNLHVTGKLTKGSGSFKIDHPLDPANKYLSHSFVESPDMMNVYNGNITTDRHGLATVVLPAYFEALNQDFRYQLTVIGQFAQAIVKQEIENNRFTIKTNRPMVKVSWQVTGIRHDAYADAYRILVEEDKSATEQGSYLHPELFGQPASKSVTAARKPGVTPDQVVADVLQK